MRTHRPRAERATGAAPGANPIPLVVPCHRVIAAAGGLGGSGGGLALKHRLLAMESARVRSGGLLQAIARRRSGRTREGKRPCPHPGRCRAAIVCDPPRMR